MISGSMRVTRLFGLFAALFLLSVGGLAGLALWNVERTAFWDARVQLAQRSYRAHLQLESHVYQLVKQHADALLIDGEDAGPRKATLRAGIGENIETVRTIIAEEIELVGEEEFEELAALAALEARVASVTRSLAALEDVAELPARQSRLARVLDGEVDAELGAMIDEALAEEQEEVDETLGEAAAFRARSRAALAVLSGLALATVGAFLLAYLRLIRRPVDRMGGVLDRLRRGDWRTPVEIGGGREFRDLGAVLGEMACELDAREAARRDEAERLEAMVDARTAEQGRLLAQIERSDGLRRRLLADISHELRTPLTIIQGEAEVTLRGGDQPAEVYQDALARIRDGARHTNRLVDDLLLISRQEAAQLRLERGEHDLRALLREAADAMPMQIGLALPDVPQPAWVDAVRLRQALLAVFQNARRHGGPTVRASVGAGAEGTARIVVEDDGPGLSDADKAQAFDRFFRGSNAADGASEGHGLGLPIVRSIVQAHGGQVALEDVEAGGLRVVVDLPRRPRPEVVRDGEGTAHVVPMSSNGRGR